MGKIVDQSSIRVWEGVCLLRSNQLSSLWLLCAFLPVHGKTSSAESILSLSQEVSCLSALLFSCLTTAGSTILSTSFVENSLVLIAFVFLAGMVMQYGITQIRRVKDPGTSHNNGKKEEPNTAPLPVPELQNNNWWFRSMIDKMEYPVQITDASGKFLYVNQAWCRETGYSIEEAAGLDLFDILHPDTQHHIYRTTGKNKKKIKKEKVGFLLARKNGEKILLEGQVHFELKDKDVIMQAILKNKTREKLIVDESSWSEQEFKFIVEAASDIIGKTDSRGNIVYVNHAISHVTGYATEALIGMNFLELVNEEEKEMVKSHYLKHFRKKFSSSFFEFRIEKQNGGTAWLEQSVKTIFGDPAGNYIDGFQFIARDITYRKLKEEEIKDANKLILQKNREITSSIKYAKVIQHAFLPNRSIYQNAFPDNFLIYKPRDIVSGDFYWFGEKNKKIVIAGGDCTGHGVPGAFMTMVGINQLNNIVNEKGITDPGHILTLLDMAITKTFSYEEGLIQLKDGMDIAICTFDTTNGKLYFAGARRPLCYISAGEFEEVHAVKKSIGEQLLDFKVNYETLEVETVKDRAFYLYSDGFTDQFGGETERKYTKRRLAKLLTGCGHLPMAEQENIIQEEFINWKGGLRQLDDVLFLGFRINSHHQS